MLKILPHKGLDDSPNHAIRTEDVRFSPSGRMLALVATNGCIYLMVVDTTARPVAVTRSVELRSASLASPHGIDFVREDMVAVANRGGLVTFYIVPPMSTWRDGMSVEPIHEMESEWFGPKGSTRKSGDRVVNCGPGSVRIIHHTLYVCCNNKSTVTAHPLSVRRNAVKTGAGALVVQAGLEIPDGLALSRDGRWLAVGDHNYRRITIYRLADRSLCCDLSDVDLSHPHGICFDPTGTALYVADAGERGVHVFVSPDGWVTSMTCSSFKMPAVDEDAFRKTKESVPEVHRPLEGGIKGIDVDASGRIIATTCQNQMLRFFESSLVVNEQLPATWFARMTSCVKRVARM